MTDADFYDWKRAASDSGLLWRALLQYYKGSPHLYRASIGEQEHVLPALTTSEWLESGGDLDAVLGNHDPETSVDISDMDVVRSRFQQVVYWKSDVDDPDNVDIEDYLWNGDVVQPRPSPTGMTIETGTSNYFSSLTLDERLGNELARGLYENDVASDASDERLAEVVDTLALPTRTEIAPSFDTMVKSFADVSAPFGVNVLTVFNTGDGYDLLLSERGEDVAVHPGKLSIIPAGGIEYTPGEAPSAWETAMNEFGEELFGIDEEESVFESQPVQDVLAAMESGTAHLDCTGISVSAGRLGVNIMAVMFIDDVEYYNNHIADGLAYNWESVGGRRVSLDNTEALAEALSPEHCVPPHLTCAYEGLIHLQDAYGVDLPFDVRRKQPR